jgi:membrane protein implicated in regulation of membrane protease activity
MKKVMALAVLACLLASPAMAAVDNAARAKELQQEAQGLLNDRAKLLNDIQKIDIRLVEINGALKELLPKEPPATMPKDPAKKA